MISIVSYTWTGPDPRRVFLPSYVNMLARAFERTLSLEHEFICVTTHAPCEFDSCVRVIEMPAAAARLIDQRSPEGHGRFPSCYCRLWGFSPEAARLFGERVLLVDVDLVVIRDLAPLFERRESFVGWRPKMQWGNPSRVGGGMYLYTPGAHSELWTEFDPAVSIPRARRAGFRGSDQAWISYNLGAGAAVWPDDMGLYSIRDLKDGALPLPNDARAVQFNGPQKPWSSSLPWVREHWREPLVA